MDFIGWVASFVILMSFTIKKDMWLLRIINSIGTGLWLTHGIIKDDTPMIFANVTILFVHMHWFIKNKQK
jgi:uncharacterized protein with PQ loop repeat